MSRDTCTSCKSREADTDGLCLWCISEARVEQAQFARDLAEDRRLTSYVAAMLPPGKEVR